MGAILRTTLLGLLLGWLSACMGPKTPQTPDWVEHPPAATPTQRYGVSVAPNLAAATLSAAGGIASGLYEEAEPLVLRHFKDPARQKEVLSWTKKVLTDLDYTSLKLETSSEMEQQSAVMLSMPRLALATQLEAEVAQQTTALKNVLKAASTSNGFAKIGLLGKAYESLPRFYAWSVLLETETGTEAREAFKTADSIEAAYFRDCFGAPISVIGDAEAIFLVNTLQHALRSRSLDPSGMPEGTILLSAQKQKESSSGRITLRTKLLIRAQEGDGTLLTERTVLLKATADTLQTAQEECARHLSRMIRDQGLFGTVGF